MKRRQLSIKFSDEDFAKLTNAMRRHSSLVSQFPTGASILEKSLKIARKTDTDRSPGHSPSSQVGSVGSVAGSEGSEGTLGANRKAKVKSPITSRMAVISGTGKLSKPDFLGPARSSIIRVFRDSGLDVEKSDAKGLAALIAEHESRQQHVITPSKKEILQSGSGGKISSGRIATSALLKRYSVMVLSANRDGGSINPGPSSNLSSKEPIALTPKETGWGSPSPSKNAPQVESPTKWAQPRQVKKSSLKKPVDKLESTHDGVTPRDGSRRSTISSRGKQRGSESVRGSVRSHEKSKRDIARDIARDYIKYSQNIVSVPLLGAKASETEVAGKAERWKANLDETFKSTAERRAATLLSKIMAVKLLRQELGSSEKSQLDIKAAAKEKPEGLEDQDSSPSKERPTAPLPPPASPSPTAPPPTARSATAVTHLKNQAVTAISTAEEDQDLRPELKKHQTDPSADSSATLQRSQSIRPPPPEVQSGTPATAPEVQSPTSDHPRRSAVPGLHLPPNLAALSQTRSKKDFEVVSLGHSSSDGSGFFCQRIEWPARIIIRATTKRDTRSLEQIQSESRTVEKAPSSPGSPEARTKAGSVLSPREAPGAAGSSSKIQNARLASRIRR
ncbi:hypothetical protein CBR_g32399 [Chara braunii]|uniref:Uncharacterized protein n=1 Tax=Chara braunii TaxID=69332 RepID=A0A388JYE5_CHABU|nr:hypothetical protein CBR_g32399 [Chara braunii]|eukprot:GBG62816.1 hypothetical protein CBR_g32399 [Chara braunii]